MMWFFIVVPFFYTLDYSRVYSFYKQALNTENIDILRDFMEKFYVKYK